MEANQQTRRPIQCTFLFLSSLPREVKKVQMGQGKIYQKDIKARFIDLYVCFLNFFFSIYFCCVEQRSFCDLQIIMIRNPTAVPRFVCCIKTRLYINNFHFIEEWLREFFVKQNVIFFIFCIYIYTLWYDNRHLNDIDQSANLSQRNVHV